jgi:hypothetical protein
VAEPQPEDDCTTADGLSALKTDLEMATLRLQELLGGRPPDQALASLPKQQRQEVREIQRMFKEWADALREARQG